MSDTDPVFPTVVTCADALQMVSDLSSQNLAANEKHQQDLASYHRWKTANTYWHDCYDKNYCAGPYAEYAAESRKLADESREWNNCVDWSVVANRKNDQWCVNDIGAGWVQEGGVQGPCAWGWGRGVCKRTAAQTLKELQAKMPGEPTQDSGIEWKGRDEPTPPPMIPIPAIECCQTIEANANSVTFNSVTQSCQKTTTASSTPTTVSMKQKTGTSNSTKTSKSSSTSSSNADNSSSNSNLIIFIFFLVMLISGCCVALVAYL